MQSSMTGCASRQYKLQWHAVGYYDDDLEGSRIAAYQPQELPQARSPRSRPGSAMVRNLCSSSSHLTWLHCTA